MAEIERIAAEIQAPLVFNVVPAGRTPRFGCRPGALLQPTTMAMAGALVELGGEDPRIAQGPLGVFRAVGMDEWAALGERYR
ncbi:hypothetical protein [Pseudonocardia sp. GCM10023141]|uniref:hypothetical protein n=1 Tax=Pseudonocardia sp. GCM10023141 TaxID=3252653 RepID=UPI003609A7D0